MSCQPRIFSPNRRRGVYWRSTNVVRSGCHVPGTKKFVEQADHPLRRHTAQAVVEHAQHATGFPLAQLDQMLRQVQLAHLQQPLQLSDRFVTFGEGAQDQQAILVAILLQETRCLP